MIVHPQIITQRKDTEHLYSILDSHDFVYNQLDTYSSVDLDQVILLLREIPWESLAAVISSYLAYKTSKVIAGSKRRVIIVYPDNSKVDVTGFSVDELKSLIPPHKQVFVSMYEDKSEV